MDDQDKDAESRERRASAADEYGFAHDEFARLDDGNAEMQEREKAKKKKKKKKHQQQLIDLENDVASKIRSHGSSSAEMPGVVYEEGDVPAKTSTRSSRSSGSRSRASKELGEMESDIMAKDRARSSRSTKSSSTRSNRSEGVAKSRGVASNPGAFNQLAAMEDEIAAKSRGLSSRSLQSQSSGGSQLMALENDIAAKARASNSTFVGINPATADDISRLDERINAKFRGSSMLVTEELNENEKSLSDLLMNYADQEQALPHDKFTERMRGSASELEGVTTDRGIVNEPDVEHGHFQDDGYSPDGLAVAVAVAHDEGDSFIPAAVEFDPDSKPPIFKNRRFRLYGCVGVFLVAVVVVAVSIGVTQSNSDSNGPTLAPTTIRETIGIQDQLVLVVGEEKLNDPTTPQAKAADWIMNQDPMRLLPDSVNLIQRYLLALFYFSTIDLGPWLSCNPPGPGETANCTWMKLVATYPDMQYEEVSWFRWLSDVHECSWAGVFCDEFNQTRAIENYGQEISGTLPSEFSQFSFLQSIALNFNNLFGTLPPEWGNSKHLVNIELHYNFLTGSIPDEWWSAQALQRLNLAGNSITGTISSAIQQLTTLKGFFNYECMMSGTIPPEFGELKFLSFTRLARNFLKGKIPSELGKLEKLQELWIHRNQLTGTLPPEVGNMRDLSDFRIHFNPINGTIPENIFNLVQLKRLDLYDSEYTGTLSSSIGKMSSLEVFRIRSNKFEGTIPSEMGALSKINEVWLHNNKFYGTMPDQLCNLRGDGAGLVILQADCAPTDLVGPPAIDCATKCCTSCCDQATEVCLNAQ